MSANGILARPCDCRAPGTTIGRRTLGGLGFEVNLVKLGGLGDTDTTIRSAELALKRESNIQAALDRQDLAMRSAERKEALALADEYSQEAGKAQVEIIQAGQENLSTTMRYVATVGVIGLIAFTVTSIFKGGRKRSRGRSKRSRSR